jgi:hypothetical protein
MTDEINNGGSPCSATFIAPTNMQIGVFISSTGLWKLDRNGNGIFHGYTVDICLRPFGQAGDLPVVGKW